MWWCFDCEQYFEKPEKVFEHHSEVWGGVTDETFYVCPICHGDDIEEATEKCDACGAEVIATKLVGNKELCPKCYTALAEILNKTADKIVGELGIDRLDAESIMNDFFE